EGQRLRFFFDEANTSRFSGTRTAFVAINGRIAWSARIAQRFRSQLIEVPLPVSRGSPFRIELGITGQNPGEKSSCTIHFDDVLIVSRYRSAIAQPKWELIDRSSGAAAVAQASAGSGKAIPMFLMPAA